MDRLPAGKPTIELIKECVDAGASPMLTGPHGVGKSQLFEQAAKELGIGLVVRDLSLMEPPDLVGLPVTTGRRTKYLPPSFLPSHGEGVLLFEELNRCERFMRAPCLQLITARELNDYKLPAGWIPAAAINPSGGDYEVDEIDPALLSRFVQVEVVADAGEWLEWASDNDVHPSVIKYISDNPQALCDEEENPRAWERVSQFVKRAGGKPLSMSQRTAIRGSIGNVHAAAFIKTLSDPADPLDAELLLSSYRREGSRVRDWVTTGRLDMVKTTAHGLKTFFQCKSNFEAVRKDHRRWKNLQNFLADLPGDFAEGLREIPSAA